MATKGDEKVFNKFVEDLHQAISECIEKGTASKIQVGSDKRTVTISISSSDESMAKLNKLVTEAANAVQVEVKEQGKAH